MALSLSPAARGKLTNLLVCFSLGNLCFLRRWYDLEHLKERSMDYYRSHPASSTLLLATLIGAFMLTGVFWAAWWWVERRPTPTKLKTAMCGFLLCLMYPLESVRRYWNAQAQHFDLPSNAVLLCLEAVLGVGIILALLGNARIAVAARRVALVLTLLFPSLILDFSWGALSAARQSDFAPRPPLPMLPAHTGRRMIWLLFDEFDQRLAFDLRQPAVDLPELDRLRASSFVANQARQTAEWTTLAVPSLLTGTVLASDQLVDANTLLVFPEGASHGANWRDQPNVFKGVRGLGLNGALVGWHHPYCRIIGGDMVRCMDLPSGHPTSALIRETSATELGLRKTIVDLFFLQVASVRDIFRIKGTPLSEALKDEFVQRRQQQQYFKLRDRAIADAVDPQIDFLFIHLPAPHLFGIYNRKRGDFTLNNSLSYVDNLALVDRTVGELRRALDHAGLWDSTTLLITSDHGLRPDLWRGHMGWTSELERLTGGKQSPLVPFIVKLAGQNSGAVYNQSFSNALCTDFVLATLSGKISTASDAAAWLDEHVPNRHTPDEPAPAQPVTANITTVR